MLLRLVKLMFFLAFIGVVALIGFAYLGDLSPDSTDRTVPVTLDGR